MGKKELLKQLIAGFQALLPIEVCPRELTLPLDSGKIITVPGEIGRASCRERV